MLKIEFGFGLDLDRDGAALTTEQCRLGLAQVRGSALNLFGGCTLTKTQGDWQDPETGHQYSEHGATLAVLVPERMEGLGLRVEQLATDIKRSLKQKAVYVTRFAVQSQLY